MRRLLSLVLVAALTACQAVKPSDPRLMETTFDGYRLDAGDRLRVTVFGQADLTGEFGVNADGHVGIPLIEPVEARGKTTEEFARAVEDQLRMKLLRNPSVSVEITTYRPFFILGEVNHPGQYPFVNGMTVKAAAAIAGGFTYRAATQGVTITRKLGEEKLEGNAAIDAPVMPGDTIVVAERVF